MSEVLVEQKGFKVIPEIHAFRHIPDIFEDGIACVDCWDFSRANLNEENRILAITQVASICYQSPKALGSESLYNRLAAESMGLPSSSFEFVPVLLDPWKPESKKLIGEDRTNSRKFGEWIVASNPISGLKQDYLLTNYRAIYYDYENAVKAIRKVYDRMADSPENVENLRQHEKYLKEQYLGFFNTEAECNIIKDNFYVFLFKVDFPTRSQMVRHRVNWQELSRRYVSGKRVPFEFYISEGMKKVTSSNRFVDSPVGTDDIIESCLEHYYAALEQGVKPQEARRIIPQAGYSQIWGAFQPSQLENFFKLRLDEHAQWEIRKVAEAMKYSIDKGYPIQKPLTKEQDEENFKRLEEIASGNCKFIPKEEISNLLGE